MNIENREKIEWLNYWIEDANIEKKRILLIGDSVTRELRKKMNMFMNSEYAVDLMAMSYSIMDRMTLLELKHFFDVTEYTYEYVFFHLGGHHGYTLMCIDSEENEKSFTDKTCEILEFLKSQTTNLIAMSITLENPEKQRVKNSNREIIRRNEIIELVAQRLGVEYLSLNKELDYAQYAYSDWCHFYEDAYEQIARIIIADFFPTMVCPESNRIFNVDEFDNILDQNKNIKIYVYGNGKRREHIEKYFLNKRKLKMAGVIVSEEYRKLGDSSLVSLKSVEKDTLIIVTPYDIEIWKTLEKEGYQYVSLSEGIYRQIRL